jgi:hypothetical protein
VGGRGEHGVTGGVAVGVVDVLEVVQVNEDHQGRGVAGHEVSGAGGPTGPGAQAGQRVSAGGGQAV